MGRMPVPDRIAALSPEGCPPGEPWALIRRFHRLSPCRGLVAYALRTRAPLSCPEGHLPFDLHVLGLPLAFILSQDQTLHCIIVLLIVSFLILQGSPCVLSVSLPYRHAASRLARLDFLMLAFKLSKNSRKPLSFFSPPFLSFAGAKVLHFHLPPTTIFIFFQCLTLLADYQCGKFRVFLQDMPPGRRFPGKNGGFRGFQGARFRRFPRG